MSLNLLFAHIFCAMIAALILNLLLTHIFCAISKIMSLNLLFAHIFCTISKNYAVRSALKIDFLFAAEFYLIIFVLRFSSDM